MAHISNPDTFEKIKRGDEKAFSQLFDQYYPQMCFFAGKYLPDFDLARSVVQQVFVDLWVKREKISITRSVKSYLYNSTRNAAIDYLRKQKSAISLDQAKENFQVPFRNLIEESEVNDTINKAINELPEKCREVFVLCRHEGLKYSQIAERLNISVKTVEMQMGIAIKKMRNSLSEYQLINLLVCFFSKKY